MSIGVFKINLNAPEALKTIERNLNCFTASASVDDHLYDDNLLGCHWFNRNAHNG